VSRSIVRIPAPWAWDNICSTLRIQCCTSSKSAGSAIWGNLGFPRSLIRTTDYPDHYISRLRTYQSWGSRNQSYHTFCQYKGFHWSWRMANLRGNITSPTMPNASLAHKAPYAAQNDTIQLPASYSSQIIRLRHVGDLRCRLIQLQPREGYFCLSPSSLKDIPTSNLPLQEDIYTKL
jgi:hypothetical protein